MAVDNSWAPKIFSREWQRWIPNPNYSGSDGKGGDIFSSNKSGIPYGDLAAALNAFMQQQAKAPYAYLDPATKQATKNTEKQLAGEFTTGQTNNFYNAAAERGIVVGAPGSPAINSGLLATILNKTGELQQQGAVNLRGLVADTPVAPLFNPASLFVPERLANMELGAARAGRNSIPNYNYNPAPFSNQSYGRPTTGSSTVGGTPSHGVWAGPTTIQPNLAYDDWFRDQLYADEEAMDWTGYNPFGAGGGQDDEYDYFG